MDLPMRIKYILLGRRAEVAEAAITLPVAILVALFMANATLAGFASVNANNAANYGARIGSVTQGGSAGAAAGAANQALSAARVGEYQVSVSGGGAPGSTIAVSVEWSFPNFFAGLAAMFGATTDDFEGRAVSFFKQEGW